MTIDSISSNPIRPDFAGVGVELVALPIAGHKTDPALEAVDAVKPKEEAPSRKDLEQAVAKLNKSVQDRSQSLEFSIDDDSKRTVVKVIDLSTKEVLRQIPTPEALQIAKAIDSRLGLLVDQEA